MTRTFDWLAPVYYLIETAVFGRNLQLCRVAMMPRIPRCRRVLIVGEGDGRFLGEFLRWFPSVEVDVVDASPGMLTRARRRIGIAAGNAVRFWNSDARMDPFPAGTYDLVVTNFFLDCFDGQDLSAVICRLGEAVAPGGFWIVGDFRIPTRGGRASSRRALVKLAVMYRFFRATTTIPASRLEDPRPDLQANGFAIADAKSWQDGFLVSELWQKTTPEPPSIRQSAATP